LLPRLSVQYSIRCSLFQFQKYHSTSKRMDALKTILTTITGGDTENNLSVSSNEIIRHQLCKINDLQNGQMKEFEIKTSLINTSVLLIKQDNKFYCYSSKCCHYKLPLAKGLKKKFFSFALNIRSQMVSS
jgi:hypothetical protein